MQMWDAVIVGAGPAGCAAAYDLAASGRRVLLLDKAEFPRPKACAGGLTAKAVKALRYSIAPVVRRRISEIVLEHPSVPRGAVTVARRKPVCVMTVRAELDAYCLERTQERGAQFLRVGAVHAVTEHEDHVAIALEGEPEQLRARYLVGADGVHSRVRALVEAPPSFRKGFALEANVAYRATRREFPLVFDFAPVADGYGWLFPRNNHVNVGLYTTENAQALNAAALTEYIAARCGTREHDRPVGQFLGFGAAAYFPAKTRVLLAGDAAGFVDPLTGEGIYGAIASGQAAAAAIDGALKNRDDGAALYSKELMQLRGDLVIAEQAARKFYADPARGFRLLALPLASYAVLHAYSEGSSLARLNGLLRVGRRVFGHRSSAIC